MTKFFAVFSPFPGAFNLNLLTRNIHILTLLFQKRSPSKHPSGSPQVGGSNLNLLLHPTSLQFVRFAIDYKLSSETTRKTHRSPTTVVSHFLQPPHLSDIFSFLYRKKNYPRSLFMNFQSIFSLVFFLTYI